MSALPRWLTYEGGRDEGLLRPRQGVSTEKQEEMGGLAPDASNHRGAREVGSTPETT